MNPARPNNSGKLLSLKEASSILGVSVETLLLWNDHQILKPTITVEGQIGYTKEQIEQFQAIRNAFQPNVEAQTPEKSIEQPAPAPISAPIQNQSSFEHLPLSSPSHKHSRFPRMFVFSLIGVICLGITLVELAQGVSLNHILSNQKQTITPTGTMNQATSKLTFSQPAFVPVSLRNDTDSSGIQDEGHVQNKLLGWNMLYGAQKSAVYGPFRYGTSVATTAANSIVYASLSSGSNNDSSDSDSAIDSTGNIRGTADKNMLTALSGVGVIPTTGTEAQSAAGSLSLMLFFFLSISALLLLYRRQLAYAFVKTPHNSISYVPPHVVGIPEKILELDQKTDGTVVMYFQGKEIKISKPELYSESDQFITRLMELAGNRKEMEFISTKDDHVRFTSPLSRLVTRLNFVGMKRDLFFPRTAKDRVLFRRFITQEDLKDMNLTTQQVLTDLGLNFSKVN